MDTGRREGQHVSSSGYSVTYSVFSSHWPGGARKGWRVGVAGRPEVDAVSGVRDTD